jgi:hypothetical protein
MAKTIFRDRIAARLKLLTTAWCLVGLLACNDNDGANAGTVAKLDSAVPTAGAPVGEVPKEIESLTGAHTRIVWTQQQNPEKTDKHGGGSQFLLMGMDTRDGMGTRAILPEKTNYNRPIFTPDGQRIVFNDKGYEKKGSKRIMRPHCYVVNWDGSGKKKLIDAYAEDVWADPETGKFWVYAMVNFKPVTGSASRSGGMVRFLLDDPKVVETLYEKDISPNNVQVSADGKRIVGLFPWPEAGMLVAGETKFTQIGRGCWTSISPDNSYLAWVFDGAHQNVTMVHPDEEDRTWVVPLSTLKETKGREVYHPRWSNHPRIMVMSGPYFGSGKKDSGKDVQLYLGKFDPGMTEISRWVKVTRDKLADVCPDVWVSGGEQASLSMAHLGKKGVKEEEVANYAPITHKTQNPVAKGAGWPGSAENAAFVWRSIKSNKNKGTAEARKFAQFSPHFGMSTSGGFFELDETSAQAIQMSAESAGQSLEFLVTPMSIADGQIFRSERISIVIKGGNYEAQTSGGQIALGTVEAGKAAHLAVVRDEEKWAGYRDGVLAETTAGSLSGGGAVRFGDGDWGGEIEAIAFFVGKPDGARITANAKLLLAEANSRKPIPRILLKGRLKEVTEARSKEDIEPYLRAIIVNTYEVTEGDAGGLKEVLCAQYVYMDGEYLESIRSRKIGEVYDLMLEPKAAHPEIDTELFHYDGLDFEAPIYFDVAQPMP